MESMRIYSWYRTHFDVPDDWDEDNRVLLNFGAVDYEATIFVNGEEAFKHTGGFFWFEVDVTDYLNRNGTNELYVGFHQSR
jgi:beta-galactosidase/beta-glucuronidase